MVLSWLSALTLAASVGCDSDEEPRSARSAVCDGMCRAGVRCTPGANHSVCVHNCSQTRPQYDELTTTAAENYGDCVSQVSCVNLENPEAYEACWQTLKSAVLPNVDTRSFCAEFTLALFDCGESYAVERCETDYAPYTVQGLRGTRYCMAERSCELFFTCLEAR